MRRFRFRVGGAAPGVRLVVTVRVSRQGRSGRCRTSIWPRPALVVAARPAPPAPAPARTQASPPPAAGPSPTPTTVSCHPLSAEGTCYEPGEFCSDSDHGLTGLAGDGKTITCEDNDGWRWEPS